MKKRVSAWLAALLTAAVLCPIAAVADSDVDNDVFDDWDREYTLGDINGDEVVDGLDLLALRMYLAGLQADGTFIEGAADLDQNGEIDGIDLMELRRVIAGL